ncbi:gamma-glutamyltransferase family protein [Pseudoroseicyclus aestuarii]|uniref:Gamma-glutamyltransferase 2 n=1 Tax=Pseudoroseicyclus aestuarii TaxID=1795041 RepID=A0A318SVQ1_9RHOB|nr:gamma-glutamyltransferase family protein [Pseudoroseicyclus aestuarii]PYE85683.1 gamma-glutamyltransferase 2 [Pseudoroseicyclus aestuarii]
MTPELPYPSQRQPVMGRAMVATSQPLAAQAGLSMLARGGSAADAAVAAAMVLTVVEPTGNGIGSDAFALVHDGQALHGLNASGRAPATWTPERFAGQEAMPTRGWDAVTVPGAVSGWIALWRRFGTLPLDEIAAPAIRYAEEGHPLAPLIARQWRSGAEILQDQPGFAACFMPGGRTPEAGEWVRLPDHGATLRRIADTEGAAFYEGDLAEAMVAHAQANGGAMTRDDLAAHRADWVAPVSQRFGDHVIHEIPPSGQGITALMALGMLEGLDLPDHPDDPAQMHLAIEAVKLAMADARAHVADIAAMRWAPEALLDPAYLASRAALIDSARAGDPQAGAPTEGGTVYLSVADENGMMVSFIQSNYMGFGSGVVVPGTGISMQNRGAGFTLEPGHPNEVGPGKRPFHTIIPAFATDAETGAPRMAFGVMGGLMQAQGHVQMALRVLRAGQNPQAAADAPRWRCMGGKKVAVEAGFDPALAEALRALGHEITVETLDAMFGFGGAQLILKGAQGYIGGSDPRKDGQAVAF